jgi:hypothetical protein
MRGCRLVLVFTLSASGGCLGDQRVPEDGKLEMPADPVRTEKNLKLVQANTEACTRVYSVGQRLLSSNPDLPRHVLFRAAGQQTPEIFHQGNNSIIVTQKLVEMCRTDAELSAVLALELGKMAAERIMVAPLNSEPDIRRPIDPGQIGGGTSGVANVADQMRLQEMAIYEEDQRKQFAAARVPDPNYLARLYLRRAGYSPDDLERVKSILRAADEHSDLERQMSMTPKSAPFEPPGGN